MSKKQKDKEENKTEGLKEYQYLVTLQIQLDYKNNDISPIDYIIIFDKKQEALDYIDFEIERHRKSYEQETSRKKNPIEIKKLKKLSNARVVQWWRKDTNIMWTWTYEVFKIKHNKSIDNNDKK